MTRTFGFLLVVLVCGLTSCAGLKNQSRWVGTKEKDLVALLGQPTEKTEIDGKRAYIYRTPSCTTTYLIKWSDKVQKVLSSGSCGSDH